MVKWLIDNISNIFAGVVASLIVLAGQGTVRTVSLVLAELIRLKYRLRKLYRFKHPMRIYIVSGAVKGVSEEVKAAILAGPDARAASLLGATASLLYPDSEVLYVHSSSFPRDSYKENMIIVGGPVNNSCTSDIMDSFEVLPKFSDEFELILPTGERFTPIYDQNDNCKRDYGAIISVNNPFDPTRSVVLIVGCDTYGVLAAAMVLSTRQECYKPRKALLSALGIGTLLLSRSFFAVFECDVLGNDVGAIRYVTAGRLE